jgi:3-hydroxybutyryl-CoA dehydrogenase
MNKNSTIGIIGAGTMGSGIAHVAATAGHRTLIFDASPGASTKAIDSIGKSSSKLLEKRKISEEDHAAVTNRLSIANSFSDFATCDLIIEAIVENIEIKKKIFAELESIVKPDCILATNTSSLSVTSIASACKYSRRVIGMHFFNPATILPLIEIVPGIQTDTNTVNMLREVANNWGKTPVIARDTPGFIVNRIARPFYGESIRILEEQWNGVPAGINGMATIDWAMKELGGFRMGPFELMDLIGNDINFTVTETVWKQMFYDARYRPSLTQQRLLEAGRFGKKSGYGYYNYGEGAVAPEPLMNRELGGQIFSRVLTMLINEAVDALYLNIASRDDIDLAMTKGVNYPKGLLKWCDELGAAVILGNINSLRIDYAEERYRPSVLLHKNAIGHKKFYN